MSKAKAISWSWTRRVGCVWGWGGGGHVSTIDSMGIFDWKRG